MGLSKDFNIFSARGLLAFVAAAAALSGCASRGGEIPYEPAGFGAPDIETYEVPLSQHRLAPLDKIRINVFQVEELSGDFVVGPEGSFELPLIGVVEAQGLTAAELDQRITERLAERYLRSPDVQVVVTERAEQTITVEGSVREPGVLPIRGQTTLLGAVALARGTSEDANASRVVVRRMIDGQEQQAAFDLAAIRAGEAENPPVYGNDIVVVVGSRSRAIWRDLLAVIPVIGLFGPWVAR